MGPLPRLHLITDAGILRRPEFVDQASALLAIGCDEVALHLRGHGGAAPRVTARALHDLALRLLPVARGCGALLVVNDRLDVALAAGADAVQLGAASLAPDRLPSAARGLRVGRSVHDAAEARDAVDAEWLLAGTLYASGSHPGRPGAGVDHVTRISEVASAPLIGIGGITPERVKGVRAAGAHGVAVRAGVWDAQDAATALQRYLSAV